MAITTDIEWCDSTLNLQMGCDGCELWNPAAGVQHCYAGTLTQRYAGGNRGFPASFDHPELFLERLDEALIKWPDLTGQPRPCKPWLDGRPRLIFLNDMGDTFTESLPLDWLAQPYGPLTCPKGHKPPIVQRVKDECCCTRCARAWTARSPLALMAETPHQYLLLTKRPQRMAKFSESYPLPKNVWPGCSITSPKNFGRLDHLMRVVGAGPRWISAEPLLECVDLGLRNWALIDREDCRLDWVIVGGESGRDARPMHPNWARLMRDDCNLAAVLLFFKQWGEWAPYCKSEAGKLAERNRLFDGTHFTKWSGDQWVPNLLSDSGDQVMIRVGKRAAGRLLDGHTWDEVPAIEPKPKRMLECLC